MNSRTKGRRLDGYYPEYVLFDIETTGLSPEAVGGSVKLVLKRLPEEN